MDTQNKEIGKRIRTMRLSRHLTQQQLAGESISRNMISMIEKGTATPSLHTLTELAQRLDVPVGYFFAVGEDEVAQFLKMSRMDEIRLLYTNGKYSECVQLCSSLSHPDDEIYMIVAECRLALAQREFQRYALASATSQLEKAADAARRSSYQATAVRSTVEYATALIHSINLSTIPDTLTNEKLYPSSRVSVEMFVYATALQLLQTDHLAEAEILCAVPLLQTPVYRDLLDAQIEMHHGRIDSACATLRRILSAPAIGFFTRYHTLHTLESCASTAGDFKTAYQFSTQKIHLLEQFSK